MGCTRQDVQRFLTDFKQLMDDRSKSYIYNTKSKDEDTLLELGLTYTNRNNVIYSLVVEDFSSGPHTDNYGKGDLWIFGKFIAAVEIYIKLQICTDKYGNDRAILQSFHKVEFQPLRYPFKVK